ncbi:MAG: glucosyltransferase domain-containing protein [Eubacteriales bacterium]|nr:glucosyltransferase domain-containing protein [Eubacteriales bacterium]
MTVSRLRALSTRRDQPGRLCLWTIFGFGLAAHAFSYFSLFYSHDSLIHIYVNDAEFLHEISLGRFLQPYFFRIFGRIPSPWLYGLFSLLWLTASLYLLVRLFDIRRSFTIVAIGALMVTSTSLSITNATYFYVNQIYQFAFLCTVAAAFLLERHRFGFLSGALLITVSLGLYQSYLASACGLIMMLFLLKTLTGPTTLKQLGIFVLKSAAMVAIGCLLYQITLKWYLAYKGLSLSEEYNGLAKLSSFQWSELGSLIVSAYVYFINAYLSPFSDKPVLMALCYLILSLFGFLSFAFLLKRSQKKPLLLFLSVLVLLLFPLCLNMMFVLSMRDIHQLMIYPFILFPIAMLLFIDQADWLTIPEICKSRFPLQLLTTVCILIATIGITFSNISFANRLYVKKSLEYQATVSAMNRIICEMERTSGYQVGLTPVAIYGTLPGSTIDSPRTGFEEFTKAIGSQYTYSITYESTLVSFMEYVMGYPIRWNDDDAFDAIAEEMPMFPAAGYCKMVDGTLSD